MLGSHGAGDIRLSNYLIEAFVHDPKATLQLEGNWNSDLLHQTYEPLPIRKRVRIMVRTAARSVLFIMAGFAFYVGRGTSHQSDPSIGSLVWAGAANVVAAKLAWILWANQLRREYA